VIGFLIEGQIKGSAAFSIARWSTAMLRVW